MPYGPSTLMRAAPSAPKTYTTPGGSYVAPVARPTPTGQAPATVDTAPTLPGTRSNPVGTGNFGGGRTHTLPPAPQPQPNQNNGGGNGGGGNGGNGGGGKGVNGVSKFIGADEQYLNALAALQQNLDQYRSQNRTDRQDLRSDFGDTMARMLNQHNQDAVTRNADYASRGIFGSGLDAQNQQDFNLNFAQQQGDATQSRDRNLGQLRSDLQNALMLFRQQREAEKLKAIQRASAQYGITGN